jgi:hypothetical protein
MLSVGGCGRDKPEGAEPAEWAADVCVRLRDWLSDLGTKRDQLAAAVASAPGLAEAKTLIVGYFTEAADTTDTLTAGLRGLEQPAVSKGEELQAAFVLEVDAAVAAFREGQAGAAALAIEDPAAFPKAAEELFAKVAGAGPRIDLALRTVLAEHRATDLGDAFTTAAACKTLSASATSTTVAVTTTVAPTLPAD